MDFPLPWPEKTEFGNDFVVVQVMPPLVGLGNRKPRGGPDIEADQPVDLPGHGLGNRSRRGGDRDRNPVRVQFPDACDCGKHGKPGGKAVVGDEYLPAGDIGQGETS